MLVNSYVFIFLLQFLLFSEKVKLLSHNSANAVFIDLRVVNFSATHQFFLAKYSQSLLETADFQRIAFEVLVKVIIAHHFGQRLLFF
jgi:hypothetical protein